MSSGAFLNREELRRSSDRVGVFIGRHLCAGDLVHIQFVPDAFAFDTDGVVHVKDGDGIEIAGSDAVLFHVCGRQGSVPKFVVRLLA